MFEIKKLSEVNSADILKQIEFIFFESTSKKTFDSPDHKARFFKRWCGDFQDHYGDEFFLVMEKGVVMGYLSGCSDSIAAISVLDVPGYTVFQDLFKKFPAHLHINFHPDARGKGLGSLLVNHYKKFLSDNGVVGVHLVTSRDAQNVSFYDRLGFTFCEEREYKQMSVYFMGHVLE